MRNFFAIVIAAAVTAPVFAQIDCITADTTKTDNNTPQLDFCLAFPAFYEELILNTDLLIESHEVDVPAANGDGGGKLALFRIRGITGAAGAVDPLDAPNLCANRGGAGNNFPVLLIPDCLSDAASWFEVPGNDSLPGKLCNQGFDVWLANPKGTFLRGENGDATVADPETYWDDTIEDSGSYLGDLQTKIIETRTGEDGSFDAGSVRWLAKGCGAQEAANWLVNDTNYPEANLPERLTTLAACHVPAASIATRVCEGSSAPDRRLSATDLETGTDHRELTHWDPWTGTHMAYNRPSARDRFSDRDTWNQNTIVDRNGKWNGAWDPWAKQPKPAPKRKQCEGKKDYYTELRRLKNDVLDKAQYKAVYDRLIAKRIENRTGVTYCEENWRDIVREALCFVQPENEDCPTDPVDPVDPEPDLRQCLSGLMEGFRTCSAYSLFGPDMADHLACLCPVGDGSDEFANACDWAKEILIESPAYNTYALEPKEIGLTKFEHILQQSFHGKSTKYDDAFADGGDVEDDEVWDYTDIARTKIFSQWVEGDDFCPVSLNKAVQETFPAASRLANHDYEDERLHFPFFLDVEVDDGAFFHLVADLLGR